jgi:hypothetical protein
MGIVQFALKFPYTFYVLAALIVFLGFRRSYTASAACETIRACGKITALQTATIGLPRKQNFVSTRNDRSTYQISAVSGRRCPTMRSTFSAIIILSVSTAVGHTAEAQKHAQIQPGYGYTQAPVGHRQLTQDDVTGADQVQFDKNSLEKDNELLDQPTTKDQVIGADQVESEENGLAKTIEQENARLDRQLRGICRGC